MRGNARSILLVAAAFFAALTVAGCAGNESYPNNPPPPQTLTVGVFIGEDEIAYSPKEFGAGPTRFIITNQTGTDQDVLISTEQFDRETKIGQGQTANFKQTVESGELNISTSNSAAEDVTIDVGPERPSSKNELNIP